MFLVLAETVAMEQLEERLGNDLVKPLGDCLSQ